jgi:acyl carrier protein
VKQLCGFVAEILGVEPALVGPETGPLTLAKWDSFNHIHLVVAIEETYGIELSPDEIVSLLSVSDVARLLQEKGVRVD